MKSEQAENPEIKECLIAEKIDPNIIKNDQSNVAMISNDQSDASTLTNDQSNFSILTNDQSETETETADEQNEVDVTGEEPFEKASDKIKTEDLKKEEEMKTFSSLERLPDLPMNLSTRESIIARYELYVEIERIEDEVEKRLNDLNKQLDCK